MTTKQVHADGSGEADRTNPFALTPDQFPRADDWPRWRVVRERTRRDHADDLVLADLAFDPTDQEVAP